MIHRFRLTPGRLFLLMACTFSLVIAGSVAFYRYSSIATLRSAYEALQSELHIKDQQLEYFSERMVQISGDLETIRNLGHDIEYRLGRDKAPSEGGLGGLSWEDDIRNARRVAYENSENALLNQMWKEMNTLEMETRIEKNRSSVLARFLHSRSALIRSIPSIWPCKDVEISSNFGRRCDPITGALKMHTGIDLTNPNAVPIMATAEGIVIESGSHPAYGNVVTVYHGFGISTRYAHLKNRLVTTSVWVDRGQQIGDMGNSGRSTTRHLHYEVRIEGRPVNPKYFLPEQSWVENSGIS